MVYDWDGKEEQCYKLYVEERRPLDEVMQIMKDQSGFAPSKRAFQTQFKRWDFPSKQNPAHKNAALVERTRELWEKNTSQKDMLKILNDEGYDIKERELMRVRAKNRWLLRVPNGTKTYPPRVAGSFGESAADGDGSFNNLDQVMLEERNLADPNAQLQSTPPAGPPSDGELSPEVRRKRQLRLEKLQAESDARWQTKKRRRRTRGYSGLPADPPGPPRFPSETTIDESKHFLKLDNELYREVRDQFTRICEDAGFVKKTIAGPEKWRAAKDRLIAENAHLQAEFYQEPVNLEKKQLALDVVCTDVTKRMRTLERRMTIAEAKNILHVNPEESREIRTGFYDVLKADHFTSKLEAGDEHWKELKAQWIANSAKLQEILAPGDADPEHELKKKAMEVLCRDVMKRLRDDQTKRDPSRKKQVNQGPGPGPAPPRIVTQPPSVNYAAAAAAAAASPARAPTATMTRKATAKSKKQAANLHSSASADMQIDPSLLAAASDPSMAPSDPSMALVAEQLQQYAHNASTGTNFPYPTAHPASLPQAHGAPQSPIPIFFRLHADSAFQTRNKVWLNSVASTAVPIADLRAMAGREHPLGAAGVQRVCGIVANGGSDVSYQLESDQELAGYLNYVVDEASKATFVVWLAAVEG